MQLWDCCYFTILPCLAFDKLPMKVQDLHCNVNFPALVFVPQSRSIGETLVHQLCYPSGKLQASGTEVLHGRIDDAEKEGARKFVVLHLRFDKDMAAHSACDFGGDKAEKLALAKYCQAYGGEARISTLHKLFPLMEDKKSLCSEKELAEVEGKVSLLAAVGYYVSPQSDIFISASPGNMHNA
ncbi:hypothetical protein CRYUN_Cryun35bG0049600 [Craigia yunnanensis]